MPIQDENDVATSPENTVPGPETPNSNIPESSEELPTVENPPPGTSTDNPDKPIDRDEPGDKVPENDTPQLPGKIPEGKSQYDDQTTSLHQALIYQVRALSEISTHVSNLDTNYAPLAGELKAFFQSFSGRLETVWQNGQVEQAQADSVESDPNIPTRQLY